MLAIKIENLGKSYLISHDLRSRPAFRYRLLRDSFAHAARVMFQWLRHPLSPNREITRVEEFWALKNINLEIERGDRFGIIGHNGAGKSTLLKLLSRITPPTCGCIKIKGRVASLLEVGTGFHPELSGRENIFLNGSILGMTRAEIKRKFDEIVGFAEIEKFLDTPVKRYSSGMYVRLAFAVAAHLEPEILLVDEVLAVGDEQFQRKCLGKMDDISREGRTIVFVSHNMAALKSLCSKAIVLKKGELEFNGSVDEAVSFYLQSLKRDQSSPLAERTDRLGSGKLRVTDITFYDQKNTPVQDIESGEFLRVEFSLRKNQPVDYSKLIVGVVFMDSNQLPVIQFISDETGFCFSGLAAKDAFSLSIPRLYLRGNRYTLRVVISEGTTQVHNQLDVVDNAAALNVIEVDFWHSGRVNRRSSQALIPGQFSLD